jgi:hypothetical protein
MEQLEFTTKLKYQLIQAILAGASANTCQLGKTEYPQDNRPYGTALSQEGWPQLSQMVRNDWQPHVKQAAQKFLE